MERLYGRGTADMKGAIAAMIAGIAALRDDPAACDIVVSASVAEELVEGVAFGYVLDRYPAKAVVIGEATNLTLARAQRGRAEVLVETLGVPAHSSTPHLGVNGQEHGDAGDAVSGLPMPRDALLAWRCWRLLTSCHPTQASRSCPSVAGLPSTAARWLARSRRMCWPSAGDVARWRRRPVTARRGEHRARPLPNLYRLRDRRAELRAGLRMADDDPTSNRASPR
jgi:hypothetical protein